MDQNPGIVGAGIKKRKEKIREFLLNNRTEAILAWIREERDPMRVLTSLLFDADALVKRRAIAAIGLAAGFIGKTDETRVRRQIQDFFWMMNDESGALCWHAPEAIGEILVNAPSLLDDYGKMLPSFLEESPFEAGVRRALTQILSDIPNTSKLRKILEGHREEILAALTHLNPDIRGTTILLIYQLAWTMPPASVAKLENDLSEFADYDFKSGELVITSIAELIKKRQK